jgi:hypothetical protein
MPIIGMQIKKDSLPNKIDLLRRGRRAIRSLEMLTLTDDG